MLTTKEILAEAVTRECKKHINDRKYMQKKTNELVTKYQLPIGLVSDIITLRVDAIDQTEYILFCILSVYAATPLVLKKYFTEQEISKFESTTYKTKKTSFPIKWNMVQVSENQWIGKITVKELMGLRDAQLINYNDNTQRLLSRMTTGNTEYYKITLNREAVNAIMDSYKTETYIPNTITLNIPEDSEYYYKEGILTIKEMTHFDILDGYHRYIAMSNMYNLDNKFNYTMELRVVCFSEDKAKQFIWQEDQKTKMHKIDSEALNQTNPANQIVQMLNSKGILSGMISRNSGVINASILSAMISILYFNKISNTESRKKTLAVRDELFEALSGVVEENPDLLDKQWNDKFLISTIFLIHEGVKDNLKSEAENLAAQIDEAMFTNTQNVSLKNITRLRKLYYKEA